MTRFEVIHILVLLKLSINDCHCSPDFCKLSLAGPSLLSHDSRNIPPSVWTFSNLPMHFWNNSSLTCSLLDCSTSASDEEKYNNWHHELWWLVNSTRLSSPDATKMFLKASNDSHFNDPFHGHTVWFASFVVLEVWNESTPWTHESAPYYTKSFSIHISTLTNKSLYLWTSWI